MTPEQVAATQQMIDEAIKKAMAFQTKKYGDTPTDDLQLVPKKYVDSNSGSPAGSNTQIQYNNNGSFGASPFLTFIDTPPTLTLGNGGGSVDSANIETTSGSVATAGDGMYISIGNGGTSSGAGGPFALFAGSAGGGNAAGGAITLDSGFGAGSGAGGNVTIDAGDGGTSGAGGGLLFSSGNGGGVGAGGNIQVTAGSGGGNGTGGEVIIYAGAAGGGNNPGGNMTLRAGEGLGSGAGGTLYLKTLNGGATGTGGGINMIAGDGGATSGRGGQVSILSGNGAGTNASAGNITLAAGIGITAGNGGDIVIFPGQGGGSGSAIGGRFILEGNPNTNDNKTYRVAGALATTGNTATYAPDVIYPPSNAAGLVHARVVARRTGGASGSSGDMTSAEVVQGFKNVAGTLTLVGALTNLFYYEDAVTGVAFAANGSAIKLQVTGRTTTNYSWAYEMWYETV